MIQNERIQRLNKNSFQNNKFILYWMQSSQRSVYNHALEYSIFLANKYNKPLVVYFGLWGKYPDANLRHYYFMLQGLKEVKNNLNDRGIKFIIQKTSPDKGVIKLSEYCSLIVVDRGYLNIQKKWRDNVSKNIKCPLIQVESDVVVPVEIVSNKEEYAAYTFRPKLNRFIESYLKPFQNIKISNESLKFDFKSLDIENIDKICYDLRLDNSVKPSKFYIGGFNQAKKILDKFIKNKLNKYHEDKNDPNKKCTSNMSPYLHFGQISPLYISLRILKHKNEGANAYFEELIIRRELSMNYIFYNNYYDSFNGLPNWSKNTLMHHTKDKRDYIYSLDELENAQTHDSYWNACQKQMIQTGMMHGYLRMYWGKKIIEWTKNPLDAFNIAVYLNNKYELDGRDPNSFTGIAWCFGKHDRPWFERKIFGKVRYMNDKGLKRKFDADKFASNYE